MNKTISINLAGVVFNIDENAYQKLDKYLQTISGYFSEADGKKEIMADIESRVAEMFQERMSNTRNVISEEDVDHVISIMGQPEDYLENHEGEKSTETETESEATYTEKRLFRDPDNRVLGGVCSGIGHYFGFDPIFLRILFVLALVFFGSGVLLYIILWAIIPKAVTASDKLQMKGEAITVDNIKRRVQDEAERVKKKINKTRGSGSSVNQFGSELQSLGERIFGFFANIIR